MCENFKKKKAIIFGGSGFLGSHLVSQLLMDGYSVFSVGGVQEISVIIPGASYLFGDISQAMLQKIDFSPDYIYYLAGGSSVAQSLANPSEDILRTVYSLMLVIEQALKSWTNVKLLYVSSAAVYGNSKTTVAGDANKCLPISSYGAHKKIAEELLAHYGRMRHLNSVIVRPFSVYGPGLKKQLLWDALQKADRNDFQFFGSGHELRDWVYVTDVVRSFIRAIDSASSDVPVYNIGTGNGISVAEVLGHLLNLYKPGAAPVFLGKPKEGDPDRLVADYIQPSPFSEMLTTQMECGLGNYIEWYKSLRLYA
jgi:UDP-glucose 4-epimerase